MLRPAYVRADSRGFTLVEMLAVLVITALATAILFEGMGQVLRLNHRFGAETAAAQQGIMIDDWFRQTIHGLQPDYADGSHRFAGDGRHLRGLTTSPLSDSSGVTVPFAWELAFDPHAGVTQLRYGQKGSAELVMEWPGNTGRFLFMDADGQVHESWPPPLGHFPQLPASVRLEAGRGESQFTLVASPLGPVSTRPRARDIIGSAR